MFSTNCTELYQEDNWTPYPLMGLMILLIFWVGFLGFLVNKNLTLFPIAQRFPSLQQLQAPLVILWVLSYIWIFPGEGFPGLTFYDDAMKVVLLGPFCFVSDIRVMHVRCINDDILLTLCLVRFCFVPKYPQSWLELQAKYREGKVSIENEIMQK